MSTPTLSPVEARVLGVLIEKQHTVPDSYPMSLNAITLGCNQKTSRDPLMNLGEGEVQTALDELRHLDLVIESSGGRVMRYSHNTERVLGIPAQSAALVAVLLLRGPQTVAELRINSERLHRFADASTVEAFLEELAARASGALVAELPRQPGTRETRWVHLLSGTPGELSCPPVATADRQAGAVVSVETRVASLETEVSRLRDALEALRAEIARITAR